MCLAVPGRIVEVFADHGLRMARVDFGGTVKKACLEHVPEAGVGDYVLVHVGFALARVDAEEAARTYQEAVAAGWGREDFSAVTHVIERRIGRRLGRTDAGPGG